MKLNTRLSKEQWAAIPAEKWAKGARADLARELGVSRQAVDHQWKKRAAGAGAGGVRRRCRGPFRFTYLAQVGAVIKVGATRDAVARRRELKAQEMIVSEGNFEWQALAALTKAGLTVARGREWFSGDWEAAKVAFQTAVEKESAEHMRFEIGFELERSGDSLITMDAGKLWARLSGYARAALQREALRTNRPLEEVIVSILVEKAERITAAAA